MPEIILASSSPRRQTMFKGLGLSFTVDSPDINEDAYKGEVALGYVKRIAKEKALEVSKRHQGKIIVAADTTVAVGRTILGKPENKDDAERMLRLMSGRRHVVLSSVAVIDVDGNVHQKVSSTKVKMKSLSSADIERHVVSEENWQGKAGAYGIQTTAGGVLVSSIYGSHTGVIGMPLVETINLLRRCGVDNV